MIARKRAARLLALPLAFSLLAAACGDDDTSADDDTTTTTAGGGGGDLSGTVEVTGSSTVEPVSRFVGDAFADANSNVTVDVRGPGTGDGYEEFCNGEAAITGGSRAIREAEAANCEANGIEFVELFIARDALTVATSPANDAVECLSFPDLYALLGPESTGFDSWSDANELGDEVGGSGDYPDAPLTVTGPGEESGTYDYFVEAAIGPIAEERGEEEQTRPDYTASPNDAVIVEGISGSDTSLGWVGYAFYIEETDRMKAIEVDGGDGCVAPSPETVNDGTYPLARPLFIYVNLADATEGSAVEAYVDYYLSEGLTTAVAEVGYVPLSDDEQAETTEAWTSR